MKGKLHKDAPPGYCTVSEVCAALQMSRTNFYKTGLVEALPRWSVGGTLLFRLEDVAKLQEWLEFRQARLDAGDRSYYELAPDWIATIDDAMDVIEGWEDSQLSREIERELLD